MSHVANVTIDNTKVSADLTDFPVYINLADLPSSFWDVVANGGGDIRVFKSDGTTELAREVVSCDTATDTGELHVKYSGTLSSSSDTVIKIYADGSSSEPASTATYGSEAVWSDYDAVYHCNDASGALHDSAGNYDASVGGGTAGYGATGKISKGLTMSGDWFDAGTSAGNFSDNFALSIWANVTTGGRLIARRGATAEQYDWYMDNTTGRLGMYDGSAGYNNGTTNWKSSWAFLQWVKTSGTAQFYGNGSTDGTSFTPTITTSAETTNIGAWNNGANMIGASVDEIRMRNAVTSASWISTEYNNQNSPSTFYSVTAITSTTYNQAVTATATFSPSILQVLTFVKTLSDTVSASISILKQKLFYRTLSDTVSATATMIRGTVSLQTLNATVSAVATLTHETINGVLLVASMVGTATLTGVNTFARTLSDTVTGSVSIAKVRNLARTITAGVSGTATLTKNFIYDTIMLVTASMSASLTQERAIGRILSVVAKAYVYMKDSFWVEKYERQDDDYHIKY